MRIIGLTVLVLAVAGSACKKDEETVGDPPTNGGQAVAGEQLAKAKTTEAADSIDKIYKSAAVYYTTPFVDRTGSKVECQFPASIDWTPSGNPCDNANKQFAPKPEDWSGPTWSALNFQLTEPHYFRYKVESSGSMANATMTITASADLDCDGTWSTFKRVIKGDPQATRAECSFQPGGDFERQDELE